VEDSDPSRSLVVMSNAVIKRRSVQCWKLNAKLEYCIRINTTACVVFSPAGNCWICQPVSGLLNTHDHTYVPISPVQQRLVRENTLLMAIQSVILGVTHPQPTGSGS